LSPALLTRMSRRGMSANAVRIAKVSVTSNGITRALPPAPSISRATASSWLLVRLTNTSSAPASASANAIARPIPRPAPVNSAALPSSRKLFTGGTGIGLQQTPNLRAGLGPPTFVEISQPRPETRSVGGIDLHAAVGQFFGTGGIDLLDVAALQ